MKLSCALVLTLTNLVIATPFSFSVKGSGTSAKDAAVSPFGTFGVVQPVASKTSGYSGSFSKSASSSFASSSASSSSGKFSYNAGQVGTPSTAYGTTVSAGASQAVESNVGTIPQAVSTAGTNVDAGSSVNSQITGSSENSNDFYVNTNSASKLQYQPVAPEGKPSSIFGVGATVPVYLQETSKPNVFVTTPQGPEFSESIKETPVVQSFTSQVVGGPAFPSPSPSQVTVTDEKSPTYSGGFGGPPGLLNPHNKVPSAGILTPSNNVFVSYQPAAPLSVPIKSKPQSFTFTVSTVKPSYATNEDTTVTVKPPSVQSSNNDYVQPTASAELYKPEIEPAYSNQNNPIVSNNYQTTSSESQTNDGQFNIFPAHTEVAHTNEKDLTQGSVSANKPFTTAEYSSPKDATKPIKNIQIFIQPYPGNAPHTSSQTVQYGSTDVVSEITEKVKPTNQQLYTGGFGGPAGVLNPSSVSVASRFTSTPVKIEQFETSNAGLTATGAKESSYSASFGGSIDEIKVTAQPPIKDTSYQSFDGNLSPASYITPKPSSSSSSLSVSSETGSSNFPGTVQKDTDKVISKPSESGSFNSFASSWVQNPTLSSGSIKPESAIPIKPVSAFFQTKPTTDFGEVSEQVKPTTQSTLANKAFFYSYTPYKPAVTPVPFDTTKPSIEISNQKQSDSLSFTIIPPTPTSSWQQSSFKPSFSDSPDASSTPAVSESSKNASTVGGYTISQETQNSNWNGNVASEVNSNILLGKPQTQFPKPSLISTSLLTPQSTAVGSNPVSQSFPSTSTGYTSTSSWQQNSYKPSVEGSLATSFASDFSEGSKITPTKNPTFTGFYTVSKPTQKPSETYYNVAPVTSAVSATNSNSFSAESNSQSTSGSHQQSANYPTTAASFVAQEPSAQVIPSSQTIGSATVGSTATSFSQQSSYKPLSTTFVSGFSDTTSTSLPKNPSLTGGYIVPTETQTTPSETSSNGPYLTAGITSGLNSNSFSEKPQAQSVSSVSDQSQSQVNSNLYQQSTNYKATATSVVVQKPTASEKLDDQTIVTSAGPSFTQQSYNKPSPSSSVESEFSINTSSSKNPSLTEGYIVSKETQTTPSETPSSIYPTASVTSTLNSYSSSEQPQSPPTSSLSHQSDYGTAAPSFVTQKPTVSVNLPSQTISSTSAVSESTSFSQQSSINQQSIDSSSATSTATGFSESSKISTPKNPSFTQDYTVSSETQKAQSAISANAASTASGVTSASTSNLELGKPQSQFPTKPIVEITTQNKPVYSNTFGTLTGAVKPSSYPSSSTGYPWTTSNFGYGSSFVSGSNDKAKQPNYQTGQYKPTTSGFVQKTQTFKPFAQFTGSISNPSNIPSTVKPNVPAASLNNVQQSIASIESQKEKESKISATLSSSSTFPKPNQAASSTSGVSPTSSASSIPSKVTSQASASNPSIGSTFGSSLSQYKPQYQFTTVQPATQKNPWYSNTYGTFGASKPNRYTYPGFSSSFTNFGYGQYGSYDKTKQTNQYTSTGQYKPISTGQYKPTYNWGQQQYQKPLEQPKPTGGSFISSYASTTSKPVVTSFIFNKLKPNNDVSISTQKEATFTSRFGSSADISKPTNPTVLQGSSFQTTVSSPKPTSNIPVSGSASIVGLADKPKDTTTITYTTPKYETPKPVSLGIETISKGAEPVIGKPSGLPILPSNDNVSSKPLQPLKPVWSSNTKENESSYPGNFGVASSILKPSSPSTDISYDKNESQTPKPITPVGQTVSSIVTDSTDTGFAYLGTSNSIQKPLNQINVQVDSSGPLTINKPYQTGIPDIQITGSIPNTQKNPSFSVISPNKESSQSFSSDITYQSHKEFDSNSKIELSNVNPTLSTVSKPEYILQQPSAQLTPPNQLSSTNAAYSSSNEGSGITSGIEYGSVDKSKPTEQLTTINAIQSKPPSVISSESADYFKKPGNTVSKPGFEVISDFQKESVPKDYVETGVNLKPTGVVNTGSTTSSTGYVAVVKVDSKVDKAPYNSQTVQYDFKPSSATGSAYGYSDQQNVIPTVNPTIQSTYVNTAGAVYDSTKPASQHSWSVNDQHSGLQLTKPNIQVSAIGQPSSTVQPIYAGGFGGPSGILKPNDFSSSTNQVNTPSQYNPSHSNQATSDSGAAINSYSGGFGGPSGVLSPNAVNDKPSFPSGFHSTITQSNAQPTYNVAAKVPVVEAEASINQQPAYGAQVSAEAQASTAGANAGGLINSGTSGNIGFSKGSQSFGVLSGGSSASVTSSTAAGTSSSGFGASFKPSYISPRAATLGRFPSATILGRR